MREVKVYDATTDELIGTFDAIKFAAYECEVSEVMIRRVLNGEIKSAKGMYFTSDTPKNFKHYKVYQYDAKSGELINTFSCLEEAARETGIHKATIRNNLVGNTKTVNKKQFIFKCDELEYKPKNPEPYIQKGVSRDENKKSVDVFDCMTNELIGTFKSVGEAADFIGCNSARVSQSLRIKPKNKSYGTIYKKYYCKYHK